MSFARFSLAALAVLVAAATLLIGPPPASATKKPYEDKKLGFRLKIEDSFVQNPPKLTGDEAFIVGDWYEDAAKFDSGFLRPTFQMFWFVEPKEGAPAPAAVDTAGGEFPDEDAIRRAMQEQFRVKSGDEYLDGMLESNVHLFGKHTPMADRWKTAEKDKTSKGVPFEFVELNPPKKKMDQEIRGYGYIARMRVERPKEFINLTFFGSCSVQYTKRFQKEFPSLVKSFEETRKATDSRNEAAARDLEQDPVKRRAQVRETKLVKGWKAVDTKNYIIVHHEDVDAKLCQQIGAQIEAIRAQVYEVMFPPDRPITAVCIVRVCKDQEQYMSYGAPGGSAGYWDSNSEELVFYEDQGNKKDSLRVLYHEAFHQYIFYSVGDFAPHSWFNEGHGDYFAGHDYQAGTFQRGPFQWRVSEAKEWKRNPKRPPLKDWIQWTQGQYYGGNKDGVPIGANYALGWSFVYFLRSTKKPEYQGILDRYFNTLKGSVTASRALEEAFRKKMDTWREQLKTDPSAPMPERDETNDVGGPQQWLRRAVEEAFRGVDWDKLEKDWLAADY